MSLKQCLAITYIVSYAVIVELCVWGATHNWQVSHYTAIHLTVIVFIGWLPFPAIGVYWRDLK